MSMIRTTVYLPAEDKRRLTAAARRRRRSEAELIRDAIERLLAEEPARPLPDPPEIDIDPEVADRADEHLARGFGADGLEATTWRG
jgi:Arc/MetJ-type ribon-helix-helix transcriptional regulator